LPIFLLTNSLWCKKNRPLPGCDSLKERAFKIF
jgi:hypothetical protein